MKIVNYRNTPFLRLVIPFCLGILLGNSFPSCPPLMLYGLALLALLLPLMFIQERYAYQRRWLFGFLLHISLMVLGYVHARVDDERFAADHFSNTSQPDKHSSIVGTLIDAPSMGKRLKLHLMVDQIGIDSLAARPASGHLMLYVEVDSCPSDWQYGTRLILRAKVLPVAPTANPHAFDYRNYLHHQNIHYTAYLKPDDIHVLEQAQGNPLWSIAFRCRDHLLDRLQHYFPTEEEYAVASALLVGYKEDLSDEIKKAYADTGSMHALAVSGTHVGLLYVGLMFLLQRLPLHGRRGRLTETLIALVAIWAFTLLTGATASVLRASVMFSTYLLGNMLYRQANIWNVLSASAFGLLVFNPNFLFDAGFQLSYAAVAGMAFFYPMFYKVSPIIKNRWLDEGWKVLLVGIAAQLGTLPLSLYYFSQFPCYFWLAGWVVVLGGAIFLWAGTLLLALDACLPSLAFWCGKLLWWMLWGMNKIIFLIQDLPGSVVSGIWVGALGTVGLYLVIGLLGYAAAVRNKSALFGGVTLLWVWLSWYAASSIGHFHQEGIIIYSINKGRMIDLVNGKTKVTLTYNTTSKQETFATQSNRWALSLTHEAGRGIPFYRDTQVSSIVVRHNILQVGNTALAVVDQALPPLVDTLWQYPVSILLLSKNAPVNIPDCLQKYPAQTVVFDLTNSRKKVEAWTRACSELEQPCWDIRSQGAFVKMENKRE